MNITTFAAAVLHYCERTRGSVTEWISSPQRNVRLGRPASSAHLRGLAVVIVYDEPDHGDDRAQLAMALGLELEPTADGDRLQPFGWTAWNEARPGPLFHRPAVQPPATWP